MMTQKEHRKATLMHWSKEEMAEHIMMLEHNLNSIGESFDIQYKNVINMLNQMSLVNKTYVEAKEIIKRSELKGGE